MTDTEKKVYKDKDIYIAKIGARALIIATIITSLTLIINTCWLFPKTETSFASTISNNRNLILNNKDTIQLNTKIDTTSPLKSNSINIYADSALNPMIVGAAKYGIIGEGPSAKLDLDLDSALKTNKTINIHAGKSTNALIIGTVGVAKIK